EVPKDVRPLRKLDMQVELSERFASEVNICTINHWLRVCRFAKVRIDDLIAYPNNRVKRYHFDLVQVGIVHTKRQAFLLNVIFSVVDRANEHFGPYLVQVCLVS